MGEGASGGVAATPRAERDVGETTLRGCVAVSETKIRALERTEAETTKCLAHERQTRRELLAKLAKVAIGDMVSWTKGGRSYRGRVERFTQPMFWRTFSRDPNYLPPLALGVRVIRKTDGKEGAAEIVEKWTVE